MNEVKNECFVCGTVTENPVHYTTLLGEKFYQTYISVKRKSNKDDLVPVRVSERADGFNNLRAGDFLYIKGTIRSFNEKSESHTKLQIYLFADFMYPIEENQVGSCETNSFSFCGTICKQPSFRRTPNGFQIADVILAVNGSKRSFYIPSILFGRNAKYLSEQKIGTKLNVVGRFQSREYEKQNGNSKVVKTAFELALTAFEIVDDKN
ncbi:MAG: single-stranded DNA-binding protein [Lachnospiraceae bacterium]|nr:single-stranded DNA-binding protein [Lachnospiraceae bacterium]